jgi:MFS family permease
MSDYQAGMGTAGTTLPFVINWCLESFGFRTLLRMWAVLSAVLIGPLLYFLKPRLPISSTRQARPLDLTFLWSTALWTLGISNILQSLGYFLPSIYLPTIAQSYGSSSMGAALTLVFQNLAAVFGGLAVGALVDRFHVTSVMMMVATVSALAVFFVWGFSQSLPLLILFSILYGVSAGGFSTCWTGVIKDIQRRHAGADTGMIFGLLGAGRGIGAIVSGPLSAALIKSPAFPEAAYAYGSDFGGLIVFTGATAMAGSIGFFARQLGWI